MPVNNLIQLRRGSDWSSNPVLASGEPGFDTTNNLLKIGDGVTPWSGLNPVNSGTPWFNDINTGYINITGINITSITIPSGYAVGRLDLFLNGVKLVNSSDFIATDGASVSFFTAPASGSVVQYSTIYPGSSSAGLTDIILDTSPQLGNNLDLNSYSITGVGSGNFLQGLYVNYTGVSLSGHKHISSDITDFNTTISGLLPVKSLIAGTGISISSISGSYTIHSTGSSGGGSSLSSNDVMNIISTGIIAGSGIELSYNTGNHQLTISVNNALLYYLT